MNCLKKLIMLYLFIFFLIEKAKELFKEIHGSVFSIWTLLANLEGFSKVGIYYA